MLAVGILGFPSVVVFFVLVFGSVVRQQWRNAVARKEEVERLLVLASEEAAMAEIESTVEYVSVPILKQYHQCAVCYCPTTTRCSRCKAIRYCSGKCQINHWRLGHKDECRPQMTAMQFNDGSYSSRESEKPYDPHGYGLETEDNSSLPFEATPVMDGDDELKFQKDTKRIQTGYASSSMSSLSAFTPSTDISEMSADVSLSEDLGSVTPDRSEGLVSADGTPEMLGAKDSVVDTKLTTFPCSESTFLDNSVNISSRSSKLIKLKSSYGDKAVHSRSHPVANGGPSLQQSARNGLKTVHKVVQQFKTPKKPKPDVPIIESEIAEKYNYKTLFPYELFVKLYHCDQVELYPFGLVNCGNSCYANAVLQCLAFTRPLTSYILRGIHSKTCRKEDWCFMCEFECLILKGREGSSPLSPGGILSQIQKIGRHLGHGREEDAHEFLRYAVDTMQSTCLKEGQFVGPFAEETTLVGLTFGGYLQSKIKCMKCLGKSEQFERMMDLTVEIDGDIRTLEEALAQFTATEILDGKNKYQCKRCKSYQKAKKKLTVLEAPNILTIVLKRFQSGDFGKLNKPVRFPEMLNMSLYMSEATDKSSLYGLYAVIVHLDFENAAFSGHYVCYVKNLHGKWFKIDDSMVTPVDSERVLSEGAYILLYARQSPRPPILLKHSMASHDGKYKRRNLEAVPSSVTKSKGKSNKPGTDLLQELGESPYQMIRDGPTSNQLFDIEDWRLHSMQRFQMADSSSESSSLFSCSDVGSCSTESTKDSDFSDYIFGEVGAGRYSPYGRSSDKDSSSPLWFSRPSPTYSSFPQTHEYQNIDADMATEADGFWRRLPPQGSIGRDYLKREDSSSILFTDTTKHHRKLTTQYGSSTSSCSSSSSRETDFQQSVWVNSFETRSGAPYRRSRRDR